MRSCCNGISPHQSHCPAGAYNHRTRTCNVALATADFADASCIKCTAREWRVCGKPLLAVAGNIAPTRLALAGAPAAFSPLR
jgi:hypothetical protein